MFYMGSNREYIDRKNSLFHVNFEEVDNMKYRVRFDGYVKVDCKENEDVYEIIENSFKNAESTLEENEHISVAELYDLEAEELD